MASTQPRRILYVGTVWPEPESSAAGVRARAVLDALAERGFVLAFGSAAQDNAARARLDAAGIRTERLEPNRPEFDAFVREWQPDAAIFDRFLIEEQFGWRVREQVPGCVRVLDTMDLHALRRERERAAGRSGDPARSDAAGARPFDTVATGLEPGDDLWRELSSILRCDLTWVVSPVERTMLVEGLGLSAELVEHHGVPGSGPARPVGFEERYGFAMIGNFRHAPNLDAFRWLHAELWPRIRERLPHAEVRVYGAYPPREVMALHEPRRGFFVEGPAADAVPALSRARVNLAPLRFGAGVKGKVIEGWRTGTPVVGTPIAAEGMGEPWGGEIAAGPAGFIEAAVALHEDAVRWQQHSERGLALYAANHEPGALAAAIAASVERAVTERDARRRRHWLGELLWHQQLRATTYFSRWIELKERLRAST